jgi:hypothetical protein
VCGPPYLDTASLPRSMLDMAPPRSLLSQDLGTCPWRQEVETDQAFRLRRMTAALDNRRWRSRRPPATPRGATVTVFENGQDTAQPPKISAAGHPSLPLLISQPWVAPPGGKTSRTIHPNEPYSPALRPQACPKPSLALVRKMVALFDAVGADPAQANGGF